MIQTTFSYIVAKYTSYMSYAIQIYMYCLGVSYAIQTYIYCLGMAQAVHMYIHNQADVFFGPVCDWSVVGVARQVKFWNRPLITVGALAKDFSAYRHSEYALISRVGPINFASLAYSFVNLFQKYGWSRFKLLFEKNGQDEKYEGLCYLLSVAIYYQTNLSTPKKTMEKDYFEIPQHPNSRLFCEICNYSGKCICMLITCSYQ